MWRFRLGELESTIGKKESFYTVDAQTNKVTYDFNTVKAYLESLKDKNRKELTSKNTWAWMMAVQIALEILWIDVWEIDGAYWPSTKKAVIEFQKSNELNPDWSPWKDTIKKLLEKLEAQHQASWSTAQTTAPASDPNATNTDPAQANPDAQETKDDLHGNKEAILKDLKENHVKIEENQEMLWYGWKKVYIELPAVWNFKWFKFEYFVSNDYITKADFEKNTDFENKSYSAKDVSDLLTAMNQYMKEMWVNTDGDNADYSANGSLIGYSWGFKCEAWNCLKNITWLNDYYWFRDKDVAWKQGSRARWICGYDDCYFNRDRNDGSNANLFLGLSV